jgi:hypothetical protein
MADERPATVTMTMAGLEALVRRAMQGAAAIERERWARVCDMIVEHAPQVWDQRVLPSAAIAVLAQRIRNDDGPELSEAQLQSIVEAVRNAVRVH